MPTATFFASPERGRRYARARKSRRPYTNNITVLDINNTAVVDFDFVYIDLIDLNLKHRHH